MRPLARPVDLNHGRYNHEGDSYSQEPGSMHRVTPGQKCKEQHGDGRPHPSGVLDTGGDACRQDGLLAHRKPTWSAAPVETCFT